MPHAIVLLFDDDPDDETEDAQDEAIELSLEYRQKSKDPRFVLNYQDALPHISHLHITLDPAGVQKVIAEIDRIAAETDAPTGTFTRIVTVNDGWLFWESALTSELRAHHEAVVHACAPHRKGETKVTWKRNLAQQQMSAQYGYPSVLECFSPHVTLQVLEQRHAKQAPREHSYPWMATRLALVRTGRFGSATEIVHQALFRARTARAA